MIKPDEINQITNLIIRFGGKADFLTHGDIFSAFHDIDLSATEFDRIASKIEAAGISVIEDYPDATGYNYVSEELEAKHTELELLEQSVSSAFYADPAALLEEYQAAESDDSNYSSAHKESSDEEIAYALLSSMVDDLGVKSVLVALKKVVAECKESPRPRRKLKQIKLHPISKPTR